MNPRILLTQHLGRSPRAAPARHPDPALLRRARALLRAAFVQLQLPLLRPAERLQLRRAGLLGGGAFLRALQRSLARSPELTRALGVPPLFVEQMSQRRAHLLRLVGQAEELLDRAERCERQAGAWLRQALLRLQEVAERLGQEEAVPAPERARALRLAAFLQSFRRRAQRQAEAPRRRAARRVARAEARTEARRQIRLRRRLVAELLGTPPPPEPLPPVPPPLRRRHRTDEDLVLGADLEQCLSADPAAYEATAEALDEILGQLGPPPEEPPAGPVDIPLELDLALAVQPLLAALPGLTAEAGTSAEQIEALLDLYEAAVQLGAAALLLLRGARDGALVATQLGLLVHEQALAWVQGRPDYQAQLAELREAEAVLLQSEKEQEAVLLRAERRIAAIEQEAEAEAEAEAYERTVAEAREGKPVDPTQLEAALAWKRRQQEATAPRSGRKRPR